MRRHRLAVPVVLAASLALASCTHTPPDPPAGGPAEPPAGATVDPDATIAVGTLHAARDLADADDPGAHEALTGNVYESLFRLAETGEPVPLLATGFTRSDDGLSYTIPLAENASFSDGSALTAEDVAASLLEAAAHTPSLAAVTNVTADDGAVQVELSRPVVSLPHALAGVWIHRGELGTGPYTIASFHEGQSLTLERRESPWDIKAANASVEFRVFDDADALVEALRAGDIDIVPPMAPAPGFPKPDTKDDGIVVSAAASTTRVVVAFNDSVAPYDDPAVRQALAAAIDDESVRAALWGDGGTPISSLALPSEPWYEDLAELDAFSPEAARGVLAEAAAGLEPVIVAPQGALAEAARMVASHLADVGVDASVEELSAAQWRERVVQNRDFTIALGTVTGDHLVASIGDPRVWWSYRNPDVVGWAAQAEAMSNEAEQVELLKLIDLTAANEAASEWMFLEPRVIVASDDLSGYPLAGPFRAAGIEKSEPA